MIWLFLLVTICFVIAAEFFRDKACFWERQAQWWYNESMRLNRELRRRNQNSREIEHDQFERN